MRALVSLVSAAAVLVVGVGAASGAQARVAHGPLRTTTGEVTRLGRTQISVGRLTCHTPATGLLLPGQFTLGDRVTIGCLGGFLRSIRLRLGAQGAATNGSGGATVIQGANGTSSNVSSSATGGNSSAVSISSSSSSTGGTSQVTTSVAAEGPVTAISSSSISIGAATCPFDPASYPPQSAVAQLQVGDVAEIKCTTDSDGSPSSQVSVP